MKSPDEIDHLIIATKSELAKLENRRSELTAHLAELQREKEAYFQSGHEQSSITNQSSQIDKVVLFRKLFRGRVDVYPSHLPRPAVKPLASAMGIKGGWRTAPDREFARLKRVSYN